LQLQHEKNKLMMSLEGALKSPPGLNVIKHFSLSLTVGQNNTEC
jgi:hypothetical protein